MSLLDAHDPFDPLKRQCAGCLKHDIEPELAWCHWGEVVLFWHRANPQCFRGIQADITRATEGRNAEIAAANRTRSFYDKPRPLADNPVP